MPETVPDGPTDPRLSSLPPDEQTTIVSAPPAPPPPRPPAGPLPGPPPGSLPGEPAGRIYATGEGRLGADPHADTRAGADRGRTTISGDVVERVIDKIVTLTVEEVGGVRGLHADEGQPISVQVEDDQAEISISVQVEFGYAVHEVVEQVRSRVIGQAERLLGLTVTEVNVLVADVTFDSAS